MHTYHNWSGWSNNCGNKYSTGQFIVRFNRTAKYDAGVGLWLIRSSFGYLGKR